MKLNNLNENEKDLIIEFLVDLVNDVTFESGIIKGNKENLDNVKNILNRSLPKGLIRTDNGLIKINE